MSRSKKNSIYENLDTAFVNLGALLRYLQQRQFTGQIQVVLDDYEALIRLHAGERRQVLERDTTTGREAEGEAALQRLLVRAMDAGGRISVYSEEEQSGEDASFEDASTAQPQTKAEAEPEISTLAPSDEEMDWQGLSRTSAELIAAIERAALSVGANFDALFRATRLELADDYAFLDPNGGRFEYVNNEIELHANLSQRTFVAGLCATLHRVVERIATGKRGASVRERVALELAVLARRRQRQLTQFGIMPQLDRIAGTRVI